MNSTASAPGPLSACSPLPFTCAAPSFCGRTLLSVRASLSPCTSSLSSVPSLLRFVCSQLSRLCHGFRFPLQWAPSPACTFVGLLWRVDMQQSECRDARTAWGKLSLSTIWVLGTKLRSSGLHVKNLPSHQVMVILKYIIQWHLVCLFECLAILSRVKTLLLLKRELHVPHILQDKEKVSFLKNFNNQTKHS